MSVTKNRSHCFLMLCLQGYLPPTKNGVEPKRPSRPINITSLIRLSTTVPNTIVVSWTSEIGRVRRWRLSTINRAGQLGTFNRGLIWSWSDKNVYISMMSFVYLIGINHTTYWTAAINTTTASQCDILVLLPVGERRGYAHAQTVDNLSYSKQNREINKQT